MSDIPEYEPANDDDRAEYASPPCFMHEVWPVKADRRNSGITELLNLLLECARAAARGVMDLSHKVADPRAREVLRDIAGDEARCCAMLTGYIERMGGSPSQTVGVFYERLHALNEWGAQLAMLDLGQNWVAKKLEEALSKVAAEPLRSDLREMLTTHRRNIARIRALDARHAEQR